MRSFFYICSLFFRLMRFRLALLACLLVVLNACETKVEINGDYEQFPNVYGFLELNKKNIFIKINKSYLGEGNALDAAKVADSSFFNNINPVINKIENGRITETRALRDTILSPREAGDFYTEPNRFYYLPNIVNGVYFLSTDAQYELVFEVDGKTVRAQTVVLANIEISRPSPNAPAVSLVDGDPILLQEIRYADFNLRFNSVRNSRKYESKLVFKYKNVYTDGSEQEKTIDIRLTDVILDKLQGGELSSQNFGTELIYNTIKSKADNDENVRYREILGSTLDVTAITDDFNNFLNSASPSTGVVLEKSSFTNIEYGDDFGMGIFTSKTNYTQSIKFSDNSIKVFGFDEDLRAKRFCTTDPALNNVQFVDCDTY